MVSDHLARWVLVPNVVLELVCGVRYPLVARRLAQTRMVPPRTAAGPSDVPQ
ncbi:hypothetical protein GCM10009682_08310 [Luedemannella flava]|uniref:DUF418 domain-containing protein n=1 Tax=Luedemannella flava TaxID=349316 RepID=A0ABP4XSE5_9ACTN